MSARAGYAGLAAVPAAWAASIRASQILPCADCGHATSWTAGIILLAFTLALASAALSFSRPRPLAGTDRVLTGLSGLVALSFAFALLPQTAATLLLDPCAR